MRIKQINPREFLAIDGSQQLSLKQNKQGVFVLGNYQIVLTSKGFDVYDFITNKHVYEQSFPEEVVPQKPIQEIRRYDNNSRQVYVMNNQVPATGRISGQILPEFSNVGQSLTKPTENLPTGGVNVFYQIPNYFDLQNIHQDIDWNVI